MGILSWRVRGDLSGLERGEWGVCADGGELRVL